MERKIRNSAKALIIHDGKMLVSKINDNGEIFYVMPGVGQYLKMRERYCLWRFLF
jgi:hypothetical protein